MKTLNKIRIWQIVLTALLLICWSGCESSSMSDRQIESKEATAVSSLGWLGANACPLSKPGSTVDPTNADKVVTHGGLRLIEVNVNGPLASAGLIDGDTIVQVVGKWLPIKENPTLDLIGRIESQISAEKSKVAIGYLRNGKFATAKLETQISSLDENLPLATERIVASVDGAIQHLAALQQTNGSFLASSNDVQSQLVATSLAGLALLSADESNSRKYSSHVQACLSFIAARFADELPEDMNALTCAYVAQFLAESDIDLLEENWLDVISVINDNIAQTQLEFGAWSINSLEEAATDDEQQVLVRLAVLRTYITNQVLLAIAAWDRRGFALNPRMVQKACAFLDEEGKARVPRRMDRRTKAALSAGTAAALIALNCDRGNSQLRRYMEEALSRASDLNSSPSLSLPGLFQCGMAARQLDTPAWLRFHSQIRYLAASLFELDGAIAVDPDFQTDLPEVEAMVDPEVWRCAHWIMIRSLYWQPLSKLSGIDRSDEIDVRDHLAKKFEVSSPVAVSDSAKKDAEELTRMIIQQLKDRGMEVDEEKLKLNKDNSKNEKKPGDGS